MHPDLRRAGGGRDPVEVGLLSPDAPGPTHRRATTAEAPPSCPPSALRGRGARPGLDGRSRLGRAASSPLATPRPGRRRSGMRGLAGPDPGISDRGATGPHHVAEPAVTSAAASMAAEGPPPPPPEPPKRRSRQAGFHTVILARTLIRERRSRPSRRRTSRMGPPLLGSLGVGGSEG